MCTGTATVAAEYVQRNANKDKVPAIVSALPGQHLTAKVIYDDHTTADFKYIWVTFFPSECYMMSCNQRKIFSVVKLRDNCKCRACMDPSSQQKLLNTPALDVNIRPKTVSINEAGSLEIVWNDDELHTSVFDPKWLFKYGQSFMHNAFEMDNAEKEGLPVRSEPELWDRTDIWKNLPELSYNEFKNSEEGLFTWLDMFHKIIGVVKRFAYVKETQYGQIFDVINEAKDGAHLAFTGMALAYHTDMNYREKSPGMQLLHCLKANNSDKENDFGGRSMFVDGFRAARWMEENEPTAFHVLTSTPIRFSIKNSGMRYSAIWPVICTNSDGDITEIHYNNRTMQPLQAPTHVVTPFYHAYKLFSQKLNEASAGLEFNMVPGDLVAFNNRRILHARSAYDPSKVERQGNRSWFLCI
ncbi:hypothetical protein HAZT_HAZT010520 [Hyalella azteca]|uniref:TauD/TfdA-like domain-containing protein n=1 Tax=Hyalella azteca TaxID=294128 RepID=A0A6A0GX98_HYAAZ|nr:hypothetical protein HAZT_HAZT010520 [Hyalella azteca]